MPSLNNAADRNVLVARLDRLTPDTKPLWGKMSAPKMLAHMTDAFRMALGDLPVKPKKIPLIGSFPFKQLVIFVLPFPKNSPTAPEIISRPPDANRCDGTLKRSENASGIRHAQEEKGGLVLPA